MRGKSPWREVDEISPVPEKNTETIEITRRVKKLSNVFGLTLLSQELIAVIVELAVIGLWYFITVIVLHHPFLQADLINFTSSKTIQGEILSCITYFSYMFIPFICMVSILKQNPFRIVPVKRIKNKFLILPGIAAALLTAFLAELATEYIQVFLGFLHLTATSPDFSLPDSTPAFALYFFEICIMAPLCEEFIFRGVILHNLRQFGNGFAVLVSALLFSMIHGNLLQMPLAFLAGLVLGFFVLKSGSIWLTVLMHIAVNTFSVAADLISRQTSESTANFIYLAVVFLALVVCVSYLAGKRADLKAWFADLKPSVLSKQFLMKKFTITPGFLLFTAMTIVMVVMYIKIV